MPRETICSVELSLKFTLVLIDLLTIIGIDMVAFSLDLSGLRGVLPPLLVCEDGRNVRDLLYLLLNIADVLKGSVITTKVIHGIVENSHIFLVFLQVSWYDLSTSELESVLSGNPVRGLGSILEKIFMDLVAIGNSTSQSFLGVPSHHEIFLAHFVLLKSLES